MPLTHLYFCLPSIDSDLPILIFTNRGVFPASVPKYSRFQTAPLHFITRRSHTVATTAEHLFRGVATVWLHAISP